MTTPSRSTQVVAAILVREDRVLICQRREDQPFPLQWEFPGGKVETGEEFAAALQRELHEELGISARIGPEIATVHHHYRKAGSDKELAVELHFFVVREFTGEIENRIFREVCWEERASLNPEIFLEADRDIVRRLKAGDLNRND